MSGTAAIPAVAMVVAVAALLDWIVGEPPEQLHPVVWIGRAIAPFDREWRYPLFVGTVIALVIPFSVAGIGWGIVVLARTVAEPIGWLSAAVVLFSTMSLRRLIDRMQQVTDAVETDLKTARETLPALVGRDPQSLSVSQIHSATIESGAENLADGLVAPLLAFAIGAPISIAVGTGAALLVKTINTMDSMIGYPEIAVGTPAARLDDLVMWIPARVTAGLLAVSTGSPDPALTARRWANAPASPNAGWPMGTMARALHVRLEKPGAYTINPTAELPTAQQAEASIAIVRRSGLVAYGAVVLWGVILWT